MSKNLLESVFLLLAFERGLGSEQNVHDNSTTPKITSIGEIALDDFWRYVAHSTNELAALHLGSHQFAGSPEVQQFYLDFVFMSTVLDLFDENHVLEFDIPMDNPAGMEIIETAQQLLQNGPDYLLVELRTRFYEIDDRPSIAEFCDNLVPTLPLEHFVQFYDVWVVHLLEELELRKHLVPLALHQVLLLYDLYRSQFI